MSRTTTVTGTLVDSSDTPLPNKTITATLTGAEDPYITSTGTIVSADAVTTITDMSGDWSLDLLSPGDLSPTGLYYIVTATNFLIVTTSFAYSASPVDITTISASSPTPSSSTVLVYDYVIDPAGNPVIAASVICKINRNAIDTINNNSVGIAAQLSTLTDINGYYAFNLIPNGSLSPLGTYYNIYEDGSIQPKSIITGVSGGLVNQLIVTPTTPGANVVSQSSISADLTELAAFVSLTTGSDITDNLDRIRYILSSYTGGDWFTETLFAQLNPASRQAGNISINGSITADTGLSTAGVLSVGGNGTITGTLTVNGSLLGTSVPNVGTIPPGAVAVYTTPRGRQTLGSLAVFL